MRECKDDFIQLAEAAKDVSQRAYCPYSHFPVGAALMTGDGSVFVGCNVENASYGLTICAERCAVFNAVAAGNRQLRLLLLYTPTDEPCAPCGACRQVLNEFGPDVRVRCICDGPEIIELSVSELLPKAFGPANLNH